DRRRGRAGAGMIALLIGVVFHSAATGTAIDGQVHVPTPTTKPVPAVVYLKNLSAPRVGQDSDDAIIGDLVESGHLVLVLDYSHHASARSPDLNADVLKLREEIAGKNKTLLAEHQVDPNRLFIMPEGFRMKRDVEFA